MFWFILLPSHSSLCSFLVSPSIDHYSVVLFSFPPIFFFTTPLSSLSRIPASGYFLINRYYRFQPYFFIFAAGWSSSHYFLFFTPVRFDFFIIVPLCLLIVEARIRILNLLPLIFLIYYYVIIFSSTSLCIFSPNPRTPTYIPPFSFLLILLSMQQFPIISNFVKVIFSVSKFISYSSFGFILKFFAGLISSFRTY